jgi:hypothetical protein
MKRITVYSSEDKGDIYEVIGTYNVPSCTEIIIVDNRIYKIDDEFPNEAYPAKISQFRTGKL